MGTETEVVGRAYNHPGQLREEETYFWTSSFSECVKARVN